MTKLSRTLWVLLAATVALSTTTRAAEPQFIIDSQPKFPPSAREVVEMFRNTHVIPPGVPVPDGFTDGGRGMNIRGDGRVISGREILIVDRTRDTRLQEALKFARSPEVTQLAPQARALKLQKHVRYMMNKRADRQTPLANVDALEGKYRGQGVLLGEVGDLCNDGVCRHQSLLFKVLADEAGLKAALVRGDYHHSARSGGGIGGHAWCELHLDDGTIFIFDILNTTHFYGLKTPHAAQFLTVGKQPMYVNGLIPRRAPWITVDSPAAGATGPAMLRIVSPSTYGKVHYTLDGSAPTASSPEYTKPIPLGAAAMMVKAVAIYENGDASSVVTKQIPAAAERKAAA